MPNPVLPRLILIVAAVMAFVLSLVITFVLEVPIGGAIVAGMGILAAIGSWWVGRPRDTGSRIR